MRWYLCVCCCLPLLVGCDRPAYPGYRTIATDVHLKLLQLGEAEVPASLGDSLLLRWRASQWDGPTGSLMSSEGWYAARDLDMAMFRTVLPQLHGGDSLSIITRSGLVPWGVLLPGATPSVHDTLSVRIELLVISVLNEQAQAERRAARDKADPEGYEERLVQAFLDTASEHWERWGTSELYYWIDSGPVQGDSLEQGDQIAVHYEGRSLEDGRVFDATQLREQPLTYRVGDPDQVIEGVAVAVSLLRSGQSGSFVIPSALAFGARGVGELLPPHSPVHYRVTVDEVESAPSDRAPNP